MISVGSIIDSATVAVFGLSRDVYTSKAKELVLSITQDAALFDVDTSPDGARIQQELIERTGFHTLPAIFIKGTLIGGFLDVDALQRTGDLEKKF